MFKNYYFFFISILITCFSYSQTTLSAGDIAILQYNADGNTTKFITFKNLEAGTTIHFTDNGWTSLGSFRSGEGIDTWVATSFVSAGQIIELTFTNIVLNSNGDQLLAYQGTAGSPSFLFAINNQGSGEWQLNTRNSSNSALPTGLTNGSNAIALIETDNAMYNSVVLSGSIPEIKLAVCDNSNWTFSNRNLQVFINNFSSDITWTGSWDGTGNTNNYFRAIIAQNYQETDPSFTANELLISNSSTLTIGSTKSITIESSIVNNGTILIKNGGSLIQKMDVSNSGTGVNTVERSSNTLSAANEYTFWSAPLENTNLSAITDNASAYYSFNSSTQSWSVASSTSIASQGVGYVVSGPTSLTYPTSYTASFSENSFFNNGDITVDLGFIDDDDLDTDWNLLGNPYPSAISATSLIDNNSTLGNTIYFWTHSTPKSSGGNTDSDYAMYTNGSGGTASINGGAIPDGNIASCQGFFAQAISNGSVTFTNSMRVTGNNSNFYRIEETEKDRLWLNLTSDNSFSQILIAFVEGATNNIDNKFDGLRIDGGARTSLYSIIEAKNFGIQGRKLLEHEDIIPLGYKSTISGNFNISIDHFEGVLSEAEIILVDKELEVVHDLKTGPYQFSIENINTQIDNRFVVKITIPAKTLALEDTKKNNNSLVIKKLANQLEIKKKDNEQISSLAIYDILGREIFNKKDIFKQSIVVPSTNISKQTVIILKATTASGKISTLKFYFD